MGFLRIFLAGALLMSAGQSAAIDLQGRNMFLNPDGTTAPVFNAHPTLSGTITIPKSPDGSFLLTAMVNGKPVKFLVDTGSNIVVLNLQDAKRVGIDTGALDYNMQAQSPNGVVAAAMATISSIKIGNRTDNNIAAAVLKSDLPTSLLGMTYLSRFGTISITRDSMVMTP